MNSQTAYACLGMDSLARLICRDWDQVALAEWLQRYGHEFPVFCVTAFGECKYEGECVKN